MSSQVNRREILKRTGEVWMAGDGETGGMKVMGRDMRPEG